MKYAHVNWKNKKNCYSWMKWHKLSTKMFNKYFLPIMKFIGNNTIYWNINLTGRKVDDCYCVLSALMYMLLFFILLKSQYSSQEKLHQLPYHPSAEHMDLYAKHFSGPSEGHMISLDDSDGRRSPLSPFQRPRSRSLRWEMSDSLTY